MGLQFHTEHNEGRIYVDLTGGAAQPPTSYAPPTGYNQQQYGHPQYQTAYPLGGAPQYGGQQQQQHHQQPQQEMDYEEEVRKCLPILNRLVRSCCAIM